MFDRSSPRLAIAFAAICTSTVVGCDPSDITAGIISALLQGGGCGSCGDCAGCSDCTSCSSCDGCSCDCSPYVRTAAGKAEGFHGVHAGRRIGNSIQGRLTSSGYSFLTANVPAVIPAVLPEGIDLSGPFVIDQSGLTGTIVGHGGVRLELRNFSLLPRDGNCNGNGVNGLGTNHDCTRAALSAYYRSCDTTGTCTAGEVVPFDIDITAPFAISLDCQLTLDGNGIPANSDTFNDGLALTADVGVIPTPAAPGARAGYGRVGILDAQVTANTLERQDIDFRCNGNGPYNNGSATLVGTFAAAVDGVTATCRCGTCACNPENFAATCLTGACLGCGISNGPWTCDIDLSDYVDNTVDDLQADLNDDIDSLVNGIAGSMLCYKAASADDCPTGTTYQDATKTCRVAAVGGGQPEHCLEILVGAEGRLGLGTTLGAVTPGIEAVVDLVVAAAGGQETAANGTNVQIFGGVEGWIAGIRSLSHNPCVPVEHPAADVSECATLGSGYEFETIPNVDAAGVSHVGRCVPRIPDVPLSDAVRGDAPVSIGAGADADYEIGVAVSESFVNYAAWKIWDSGATCLSVGSWLDPTLSPSLISFALLSPDTTPRLFFPINLDSTTGGRPTNANLVNVALALAPQNPPVITFDDAAADPCESGDTVVDITAELPKLHIDLSLWGNDRYQRVGTIETDVTAVISLDVGPQPTSTASGCAAALVAGELKIAISRLEFGDAHWLPDSAMLLPVDFRPNARNVLPVQAGLDTIGGIAGNIAAGLLPSLKLDSLVNSALDGISTGGLPMGVHFETDAFQAVEQANSRCQGPPYDTGVRGTDVNCTHEFLGVYVDLVTRTPGSMLVGMVDSAVQVTSRTFPEDASLYDLQSGRFGEGETPSVEIAMSATGVENAEYEFSYRTTFSDWSPWQRSAYAILTDASLLIQGEQQVFVRARVAGVVDSEDTTPATSSIVVDVTPPMVQLYDRGDHVELQTIDLVSDELAFRILTDGTWGAWQPVDSSGVESITLGADDGLEVRDESGNVAASGAALQGRPNAANSSACGCSTAGSTGPLPIASLLSLGAAFALVLGRRRARR